MIVIIILCAVTLALFMSVVTTYIDAQRMVSPNK